MNIVFDTSVFIPLVLERSLSARLFNRLLDLGHVVILSPALLDELHDKLLVNRTVRRWLAISDQDAQAFLAGLTEYCSTVPGDLELQGEVPGDPDDDHVLAAASEG